MQIDLQPVGRRGRGAVRGHQSHQARLFGGPDDEAQRLPDRAPREVGEDGRHQLDALVHRQQPLDLVVPENEQLAHANNPASSSRCEARARARSRRRRSRAAPADGARRPRRDLRVAEHPGNRERRRLDAEVGGRGREGLQTVERLLVHQVRVGVGAQRHPRARRARLAAPVLPRQPAAGERAERREAEPLAPQIGRISRSASRRSREYAFCTHSKRARPSRALVSSACSRPAPSTLLAPTARAFPAPTTPSSARSVSSIGVSGSGSWVR